MKLLIASNNAHKIREIKEILGDLFDEILSLREAGVSADPEETGETFEENARIKAEAILQLTGCAALADDSGLEVDALGGAPGVHSARYCGRHGDDDANNALLLRNLAGVPAPRTARFVSAVALARPGQPTGAVRRRNLRGHGAALRRAGTTALATTPISPRSAWTRPSRSCPPRSKTACPTAPTRSRPCAVPWKRRAEPCASSSCPTRTATGRRLVRALDYLEALRADALLHLGDYAADADFLEREAAHPRARRLRQLRRVPIHAPDGGDLRVRGRCASS